MENQEEKENNGNNEKNYEMISTDASLSLFATGRTVFATYLDDKFLN